MNFSGGSAQRIPMQNDDASPLLFCQFVKPFAQIDFFGGKKLVVEPADGAKSIARAKNERARHPTADAAEPVPGKGGAIGHKMALVQAHRATPSQAPAQFHLRRHFGKQLHRRVRVGIDENKPVSRRGCRPGITGAGDLIDRFKNHGCARGARDFGGGVRGIVIANDQFRFPSAPGKAAHGLADFPQGGRQQLFFVECRDYDRNFHRIKLTENRPEIKSAKNWIATEPLFPNVFAVRIVKSISAMQSLAQQWQRRSIAVCFVPTMGYLHRGHISLIEKARKLAGPKGQVVVSIYVNPTQFAPTEDLAKYPRDLKKDKQLCDEAGVDVLFTPKSDEMYPSGFSTWVVEEAVSKGMEGASRPTHFRGVATVVAKLFQIVRPTAAVFGAKDFQQCAVVQRMARDLNFPLKIVIAPTVREPDGLALSSRNKYLTASQRPQATVLSRALEHARGRIGASATVVKSELRRLISKEPEARVDYIAFFDSKTLTPAEKITKGTHLALAVFIGTTRLIDNAKL